MVLGEAVIDVLPALLVVTVLAVVAAAALAVLAVGAVVVAVLADNAVGVAMAPVEGPLALVATQLGALTASSDPAVRTIVVEREKSVDVVDVGRQA